MLKIRSLSADDWPGIESLFGERGACGGCWCMEWRRDASLARRMSFRGEANRTAFRSLVLSGEARGVLAFEDDRPVGWCSVGPHESFPVLQRKRSLAAMRGAHTWVITCLFVRKDCRKRGLGVSLVDGAVKLAFASGAARIESFPAKVPASGGRLPDAFAWTGTESLFRQAGFVPCPHNPRVYFRGPM